MTYQIPILMYIGVSSISFILRDPLYSGYWYRDHGYCQYLSYSDMSGTSDEITLKWCMFNDVGYTIMAEYHQKITVDC